MSSKKILITGVTGMMGSALAAYFVGAGYHVYGSVRKPVSQDQLPILDAQRLLTIDLACKEPYPLPEGLDAVIHCAAATSEATMDSDLSRRVNVDGTARLLDACRSAQVRRFILISTMSANPENPSSYAQTKLAAETIVRQAKGIEHVILRPGLVVSSSERGIFHKLAKYVRRLPIVPVIGNNRNLSTISMDDLCKAVELSIDSETASSACISVCADESVSIGQIVRWIAQASGQNVRCLTIPYRIALWIATISALVNVPIVTKDNVYGLQYAKSNDSADLRTFFGLEAEKAEASIVRYMNMERGGRR